MDEQPNVVQPQIEDRSEIWFSRKLDEIYRFLNGLDVTAKSLEDEELNQRVWNLQIPLLKVARHLRVLGRVGYGLPSSQTRQKRANDE